MTELVPSAERHSEVREILQRAEDEDVMEINARKEAQYARQLGGHRFAIVDGDGIAVGYLSGKYRGGSAPAIESGEEDIVAFISLIVIDQDARGQGNAYEAIRQFAALAREESRASRISLRLDQKGDVDSRRASFIRMGFTFEGALGVATTAHFLDL